MSVQQVVVFIMAADAAEAEKIGRHLVEGRYVACVSSRAGMDSRYWWKGRIETANEVLLIAKTTMEKFEAVVAEVKKLHSYEVPEIIALPVVAGSSDYLRWIEESVNP